MCCFIFSCFYLRRWGRGSLTHLPGSSKSPGENTLPGGSMNRWERRVSLQRPLYILFLPECMFQIMIPKFSYIFATQLLTSCTTPKSGGRTASTGTLLETTSAWSRGLSSDSFCPRGSVLILLILSISLTADSRWSFVLLSFKEWLKRTCLVQLILINIKCVRVRSNIFRSLSPLIYVTSYISLCVRPLPQKRCSPFCHFSLFSLLFFFVFFVTT